MASMESRESSFCDENQNDNTIRSLYVQKQNSLFCDVVMKVCGREIYAHSNILAAASPYFNNFLSQDLPRQYSSRSPQIIEIQIDGSEPNMLYEEAVASVINFIYTGRVVINDANVSQVSEIARIMQIHSIVSHCEDFVTGKIIERDIIVPKKLGIDAFTNTDPIDMMLQYKRPAELNRVRGQHNKYMSMVSIATQVVPKLLGLRESEKDMADKAVSTDPMNCTSKKDSRILHVQLMVDDKSSPPPRGRGRPKKSEMFPKVMTTGNETSDCFSPVHPPESIDNEVTECEKSASSDDDPPENVLSAPSTNPPANAPSVRRSSRAVKHKSPAELEKSDFIYDFIPAKRHKTVNPPVSESDGKIGMKKPDAGLHEADKQPNLIPQESGNEDDEFSQKLAAMKTEQDTDSPAHTLIELAAAAAAEAERGEMEATLTPLGHILDFGFESEDEQSHIKEEESMQHAGGDSSKGGRRGKKKIKVEREYKYKFGSKYSCDTCDNFQTNSVRDMTRHMRQHKMAENICYFCDKKFEEEEVLLVHIKELHQGKLPFSCPECPVRCKTRTQLNLHLPKHSQEKPFICEICSQGFKWKHALKNHMITHSNKKDHLCELCGYATAHKTQMKAHERIHTGQTLRCSHPGCSFQATKMQNMKYHQMTHTGEKPHQCEICGQSFSLKKNMRRHMLMHGGDSKQTCGECDFHTPRLDKLKEHLLKMHGIGTPPEKRVRVCDLVNQTFYGPKTSQPELLPTNSGTEAEQILANSVASMEEDTNSQQEMDNASKFMDKYIIEIENECGDGVNPIHLLPNQTILIAPTDDGTAPSSCVPTELNEITIAMPPGSVDLEGATLDALTADGTATVVLSHNGEDMSMAEVGGGDAPNGDHYQITEVMIPADQVNNLVQHVTYSSQ